MNIEHFHIFSKTFHLKKGARGFRKPHDRGRVWRLHRDPAEGGGGGRRGGADQGRVQGDANILCLLAIRRGQADQALNLDPSWPANNPSILNCR